jgi:tetratricopeptide (TPR) repeat protein
VPNAIDLKNEGNDLFRQGYYKAALEKYNAALDVDPMFSEAWLNKGVMHEKLEEYAEALDALEKAIMIKPDYKKALERKKQLLQKLNQMAEKKYAQDMPEPYIEKLLRPHVCKQNYLKELQVLQEQAANARDLVFLDQIQLILKLIDFLLRYYQRNTVPYPFILEGLANESEKGRRLRLHQIANPIILQMPKIPETFATQTTQAALGFLNTVQDDIFFEDAKIILRAIFNIFYLFPRDERGKLINQLPWDENTWYLFDFCGAVFIEDSATDRCSAEGGIALTPYSFGGNVAQQKQLAYFHRSLLHHTSIIKIAIIDILKKDIFKLQDFFKALATCLILSTPFNELKMEELPHLKALLWYSKHTFNIRRLLCLLPSIPDNWKLLDKKIPQSMGLRGDFNTDQKIDFVEFLKTQKVREDLPEQNKAFLPLFLQFVAHNMPIVTVQQLINWGFLSESETGYGVESPGIADRTFAANDFATGPITPAKRLQLASTTNYLNMETLKGRLALLRKLQLIGEVFIPRNWGNQLKYIDYISSEILSSIRNGLVHVEDRGNADYIQLLETDKTLLQKLFRELQTLTERTFVETAKRQEGFPEWPSEEIFSCGYQKWGAFATSYWQVIKSIYLKSYEVDYSNFCPNVPLVCSEQQARVIQLAKPDQAETIAQILDGKKSFPQEGIESLLLELNKQERKVIKSILKNASKKFKELKKVAQEAEKGKRSAENAERKVAILSAMSKDYPTLEQVGKEFWRFDKSPDKNRAEIFLLLNARLKLLEDILLESQLMLDSKESLQKALNKLLVRDVALQLSTSYLLGQIFGILNKFYSLTDLTVFPNLEARLLDYVALRNVLEHTDPILESTDLPYYEMLNKVPTMMANVISELLFDYKELFLSFDPQKLVEPKSPRGRLKQATAIATEQYEPANSSKGLSASYFFNTLSLQGKSQTIADLNRAGDDTNLRDHGDSPTYKYSVGDVKNLLLCIRQQCFHYQNPESGLDYPIKAIGEEYSQSRENAAHIFLSDPVHELNFQEYFLDEVKKLAGEHEAYQQKWRVPPNTLVLPVLTGRAAEGHWRSIGITINYNTRQVSILWDDPFGQGRFSPELKAKFKAAIQKGLMILFQVFTEDKENILFQELERQVNQQGDCNSYDCGPIIVSNIQDYVVKAGQSNEIFAAAACSDYSVTEAIHPAHAEQIRGLRQLHREAYQQATQPDSLRLSIRKVYA